MKIKFLFLTLIIGSLFLSGCQTGGTDGANTAEVSVDSTDIAYFVSNLASDEFLGRMPFTEGETKTVSFLESELKKMGIEPGNGDRYFQDVPLVEITGTPGPTMTAKGPAGEVTLNIGDDYVIHTQREQEEINIQDSELVFCGYGIVAPEYDWNDYEGIDMKGKTAVVLVNDPGFESGDSTFFKGNTMTYYGRWTYKYEEAARQGAEGILIVHQTAPAGYPWFVVENGFMGAALNLQTADGNMGLPAIQGWLTLDGAVQLLKASGITDKKFFEIAGQPGFEPIPLGVTVSTSLTNSLKKDVSKNVVGMITGSEAPDEYIIYSAHWDHFGVGAPVEGDSIYNGAHDNASGTAAVLSIAKAMSQMEEKPKRSVVFLFVTAEEQGLLGSAHYAANPIFPPEKTVANLNMDGMNINGKMRDLTIIGYGQSDMDDIAKEAAAAQGRYILPGQEPEKGYFFRSDHFNFAKIGIPALFASGGYDHWEKGKEYAMQKQNEYTANHYHRPSDEYSPELFEMEGVIQDAQLYLNIGLKLANDTDLHPQWKEGSEFKDKRQKLIGMK
jgi:Zn-dependent M28 family amino/carboxypeptidase